ncbi:4'-phosphopantetheinyl transferase family protein [Catellatospora vulcania]|uniref:4'-phosphopantetheinyl transferase family protein n=1 Tax=Catellatospora vulcania TaxID=1460450 RepID=UPI0012D43ECC|nr:4'-phosphopantetheinyl transferase superfamily protein [Catellatospora vulcania]
MSGIRIWLATAVHAADLARHAAATALGVPPQEVEIGREPSGRPWVVGATGLHLAISHHPGLTAVAVTTLGPLGVDVEPVRDLPADGLAKRWFSPAEADWVVGHPADFLLLWTQKEAVGKALGVGLRGGGLRRPMPLPPASTLTVTVPGLPSMAVAAWTRDGSVLGLACDAAAALGAPVTVSTFAHVPSGEGENAARPRSSR